MATQQAKYLGQSTNSWQSVFARLGRHVLIILIFALAFPLASNAELFQCERTFVASVHDGDVKTHSPGDTVVISTDKKVLEFKFNGNVSQAEPIRFFMPSFLIETDRWSINPAQGKATFVVRNNPADGPVHVSYFECK